MAACNCLVEMQEIQIIFLNRQVFGACKPNSYIIVLLYCHRRRKFAGNFEEEMVEVHDPGDNRYRSQLPGSQSLSIHDSHQCTGKDSKGFPLLR